ncbi:MAG: S26 family signal peptidase [Bacteroidales bacterium]|nr:S26 family signal peptidase [Bacteroidales bacterium]
MQRNKQSQEEKELSKFKKFSKNKYLNLGIYSVLLLLLILWTKNLWLILIFGIIFDYFITKKVNWTFWKKRDAPKTKTVEWIDAIVFAGIAALLIRTLLIEAYTIPTSSMEKTLRVGDYLFVSKYHYGPRMPITPIAVPFTHNTPINFPLFSRIVELPYKRLAGITEVKNDDIVVFNFPVGDTVVANYTGQSYYELCRQFGRKAVVNDETVNPYTGILEKGFFGKILIRPIDKKDNYVKRCVAIGGDVLEVVDGLVLINGQPQEHFIDMQYKYAIVTDGSLFNPRVYENLDISKEDQNGSHSFDPNLLVYMPELANYDLSNLLILPLTQNGYEQMKAMPNVLYIKKLVKNKGYKEPYIFPHTPLVYSINDTLINYTKTVDDSLSNFLSERLGRTFNYTQDFVNVLIQNSDDSLLLQHVITYLTLSQTGSYPWNEDNFGPLWIPKAGETLELSLDNLPAYERAIDVYEGNNLEVKDGKIFINGIESTSYTFKQDYFFMMGDNRHNSADSRFWGLVPENHIVGTPIFVWLSLDKDKKFLSKIRWERFFIGTRKL